MEIRIFIALLYAIAAFLPFLGATRLWAKAANRSEQLRKAAESSESGVATYGQVEALAHQSVSDELDAGEAARRDLWLIGGGLASGAIASIWSLFI